MKLMQCRRPFLSEQYVGNPQCRLLLYCGAAAILTLAATSTPFA
jgi:hypothetical protein